MAFKFSRGAPTSHFRNHHSTNDGQTISNKGTTLSPTIVNNQTNLYKSGSYPAWLKDGSALRKAYYGSLGQVQLQPALDGNKLSAGLDRLVSKRGHEFSWDNFTDTSRVQQLLSTSRLPNSSLAAIWACCNKTRPGVLTNREVCLALGLIAIFQRVQDQKLDGDPFNLLKLEKSPPVPKLYETDRGTTTKTRIPSSSSMPNNLLIDISSGEFTETSDSNNKDKNEVFDSGRNQEAHVSVSFSNNAISLIDLDGEKCEPAIVGLTNVWMRFMLAMQSIFKRSFDILNVENSRSSALEALTSPAGVNFCKGLSLCYPIAHNIRLKIDELDRAQTDGKQLNLLDEKYLSKINNIMVSINEYWAVLINLFHSSGQTDFIELIMDGLVWAPSNTNSSETLDELMGALTIRDRCDKCAICLNEFYLINMGDALERSARLPQNDIDLLYDTKLISLDDDYYYHPKCANFWLNSVPGTNGKLPFESEQATNGSILVPTK
jgi:hypothetical protein